MLVAYVKGHFVEVQTISFGISEFRLVRLKMGSNLHAWPFMQRSRIVDFSSFLLHVVLLAREP